MNTTLIKYVLWVLVCFLFHPALGSTNSISDSLQNTAISSAVSTNKEVRDNQPVLAVSLNGGRNFRTKSISNHPDKSSFNATSCTGSEAEAICIAAGQDLTGSLPPLLAVSLDGGRDWAIETIPNLTPHGTFYAASCTGETGSAICAAAGHDFNSSVFGSPLLVVSVDGGNTWDEKTITNITTSGRFTGVSCTGVRNSAVCVAVGRDFINFGPILAVSADGGNTWAAKTIPDLPMNAQFEGVSCTGHGKCSICTAAGHNVETTRPFLSVSMDGGMSWEIKTFDSLPPATSFNAASCTGNQGDAICIAAGNGPALAVSTDGGKNWQVKTITNHPTSAHFTSASCTGGGPEAVCTAVGEDFSSGQPIPFIVVSKDGGNNWSVKTIPNHTGFLFGTSCTGSKSTAICSAAGEDWGGSKELLVVSTNGGETWNLKSVAHLPSLTSFYTTSCTGSQKKAICIAAGGDLRMSPPSFK